MGCEDVRLYMRRWLISSCPSSIVKFQTRTFKNWRCLRPCFRPCLRPYIRSVLTYQLLELNSAISGPLGIYLHEKAILEKLGLGAGLTIFVLYSFKFMGKRMVFSIDYKCDNEKKNSWVGSTSWYHCIADHSRIPKMPANNPLQTLVHPQTQKTILHGLPIPNPNFSEFTFFGK